ncbi:MAG: bifunctional riboflavin kinase/FAD synthetase [Acidobacteriota bacterium]
MQIIQSLTDFPRSLSYPVMTIGVFDGVHSGHQLILDRLSQRAREKKGTSVLLTFTPHPQKIISPAQAPLLLQTRHQKERILETKDVDIMLRLPFTRRLSLYSPSEFARQILHNHGIREIHVGSNFRFGHRRSGNIATLASLGEEFRFEVHEIVPVYHHQTRISSSYIRRLLSAGRTTLARRLLGRPYQIEGIVVRGSGQGAQLNFPTANLDLENELIPATGVYVSRAHLNGNTYPAVTNIGHRPTLREQTSHTPVVEPHLLDFEENIYGKHMKLDLCFRLRSEKQFESVEDLKRQIGKDVERTRRYMQKLADL